MSLHLNVEDEYLCQTGLSFIYLFFILFQRQLIAQKMKQKRQTGAGGMIQASNISSAQLSGRSSAWQNELHGIVQTAMLVNA